MRNKKRGISPLIATVLLVGFVISIVALIFVWWGDFVKQQTIKEELKSDAERKCLSGVEMEVKSATATDSKVEFIINNRGSETIDFIRIRIEGDKGIETFFESPKSGAGIKPIKQETIEVEYSGIPESAEVFPVVTATSDEGTLTHTCTNKVVEIKIE